MRRKRKVWYSVSAPRLWWCGRGVGWAEDLSTVEYKFATSSRRFMTAKRAFACARGLPKGTIVVRWFYKRGCWWVENFEKVK